MGLENPEHGRGRIEIRMLDIDNRALFPENPSRYRFDVMVDAEHETIGFKKTEALVQQGSRIKDVIENLK